ncbi:LytTR family transcriptional regulator [bacterium]|nr:MAG: LytTR family transcriptional regulator [bacterium]
MTFKPRQAMCRRRAYFICALGLLFLAQPHIPQSFSDEFLPPNTLYQGDNRQHSSFSDLNNILFFKSVNDYISVHTDDKKYIILKPLYEIIKQLPEAYFIRVHRSYIVNSRQIQKFNLNEIHIRDEIIPISNSYKDAFFKHMTDTNISLFDNK